MHCNKGYAHFRFPLGRKNPLRTESNLLLSQLLHYDTPLDTFQLQSAPVFS